MDRIYEHPSLSESFKEYCRVKGAIYLCDLKRINPFNLLHYGFSLEEIYNISSVVAKTFNVVREVKVNSNTQVVTTAENEFEVSVNGCTKQYTFKNWSQIPEQYYSLEIDNFKYLFTRAQNQMLRVNKLVTLKSLTRNEDKVKMALRALKKSDIKDLCSYLSRLEEIKYYLSDPLVLELFLSSKAYKDKGLTLNVNDDNQVLIFMEEFGYFPFKYLLEQIIKKPQKYMEADTFNSENENLTVNPTIHSDLQENYKTIKHIDYQDLEDKSSNSLSVSVNFPKVKYEFKYLSDIPKKFHGLKLQNFRYLFTTAQMVVFKLDDVNQIGDLTWNDPRLKKSIRNVSRKDLISLGIYLSRMEQILYYLSDDLVLKTLIDNPVFKDNKFKLDIKDYNSVLVLMETFGSLSFLKAVEDIVTELEEEYSGCIITSQNNSKSIKQGEQINQNSDNEKTQSLLMLLHSCPKGLDYRFDPLCELFSDYNKKKTEAKKNQFVNIKQVHSYKVLNLKIVFESWTSMEVKKLIQYSIIIDYFLNKDIQFGLLFTLQKNLNSSDIYKMSDIKNHTKLLDFIKKLSEDEIEAILNVVNLCK